MNGFGSGLFALATLLPFALRALKRRRIAELWVYPIKGCKGFRVDEAVITRRGFLHDRVLMVVNAEGKFISQRSHPKMALVTTRIDGCELVINSPGRPELRVSLPSSYDSDATDELGAGKEKLRVTVWKSECDAYEIGAEATSWFSETLSRSGGQGKENLRLVRMANSCVRECRLTAGKGQTGFADAFPFLLATRESLEDLNSRLARPVAMENFRPNIVLEGGFLCRPWEEDSWKRVRFHSPRFALAFGLGGGSRENDSKNKHSESPKDRTAAAAAAAALSVDVEMHTIVPCGRCKVPTNDPTTGILDANNEPTRTMKSFREGRHIGLAGTDDEREIFFGVNADHGSVNVGCLRVGDVVLSS